MGANNNFKKLMEEEEALFTPPPFVEKKIVSNLSFFDFFGQIIELFVPRIIELFIVMTGGTLEQLQQAEMPDFIAEAGEESHDEDVNPGNAGTDSDPDKYT